jgi:hypothetical protein
MLRRLIDLRWLSYAHYLRLRRLAIVISSPFRFRMTFLRAFASQ